MVTRTETVRHAQDHIEDHNAVDMNCNMGLRLNIPRSVIKATSDVTQLVLNTLRLARRDTQKNPTTVSCLDCKSRRSIFHGMKFPHPPPHLLSVQPEQKQTTHQCCLEDGACCRDMADFLHYQQKQEDALEIKNDGIFVTGVVTAIPRVHLNWVWQVSL